MQAPTFSTILFVILLILLLLVACSRKTTSPTTTPIEKEIKQIDKVNQLGKELFKQNFSLDYNKEKTIVCISKSIKKRPNDIFSTLSFVLYRVESAEILFKEVVPKATGKWLNNNEFQVITIPGVMAKNNQSTQKSGFTYNVITKTKRKIE